MSLKDSNVRITVVLDSRTKDILDKISKEEHRTLSNKISQILTSYVDGITEIAIEMDKNGMLDDKDILEKFLSLSYSEYCRKLANRINYIQSEMGIIDKKESQDEDNHLS